MPSFHDLVAQGRAISMLQSFLKKKEYPQSLIFEGESGVGKRQAAEVFAQLILCESGLPKTHTPCGTCLSCQKIQNQNHPDLVVIAPEANTIKIEQIRALQQKLVYKPVSGLKKIILIDPAEKMNASAANGLLKTLEEPPPYAMLILISAEGGSLLPTIRSRCQTLQFHPLSFSQIKDILIRENNWSADDAHLLTATAFGRLRVAREMDLATAREVDQKRHALISSADLFETAANFSGDRASLETALLYLMHWFRDGLVLKSLQNQNQSRPDALFFSWRFDEIRAWSASWDASELCTVLSDLQTIYNAQTRNVNRPLSLETLLLRIRKTPSTLIH